MKQLLYLLLVTSAIAQPNIVPNPTSRGSLGEDTNQFTVLYTDTIRGYTNASAALMLSTNFTPDVPNTAYTNINGFNYWVTNDFTYTSASGWLTNTYSGYYHVTIAATFSGGNNDTFEIALFTNSVEVDWIEFRRKMGTGGDVGSGAAAGIIYLEADTRCELQVQNTTDGDDPTFEAIGFTLTKQ